MRVLIDTNILLYAVNKDAHQHGSAAKYLERFLHSGERWCLAWVNVYEFLSVVTHHGCLPKPLNAQEAWDTARVFLECPSLELLVETPRHQDVLRKILDHVTGARGAFYYDCHIAALMQEHDVSIIATADSDFRKFGFLKVVDPTR